MYIEDWLIGFILGIIFTIVVFGAFTCIVDRKGVEEIDLKEDARKFKKEIRKILKKQSIEERTKEKSKREIKKELKELFRD